MNRYNAEWWQLYTSRAECEEIAVKITEELQNLCGKYCLKMAQSLNYTSETAGLTVHEEMNAVLNKYREFGASDTEPRTMLRIFLRDKFGISSDIL